MDLIQKDSSLMDLSGLKAFADFSRRFLYDLIPIASKVGCDFKCLKIADNIIEVFLFMKNLIVYLFKNRYHSLARNQIFFMENI